MVKNDREPKAVGGRPIALETQIALRLIEESPCPISTNTLLGKVKELRKEDGPANVREYHRTTPLWRNRCIGIRKSLREAAKKGVIQHLGMGPDGSHLWASNHLSPVECAAGVANEFLRTRQIDVSLEPGEIVTKAAKAIRK